MAAQNNGKEDHNDSHGKKSKGIFPVYEMQQKAIEKHGYM